VLKTFASSDLEVEALTAAGVENSSGDGLGGWSGGSPAFHAGPARAVPTSAFRGVFWKKDDKVWQVQVSKSRNVGNVGYFQTQQEVALAYNVAATRLGCPASWLNDVGHGKVQVMMTTTTPTPLAAGKKTVVVACARPPRCQPTSVRTSRISKNLLVAPAVGATASAQHLTPYELQREPSNA
jgi:hypothetical protein